MSSQDERQDLSDADVRSNDSVDVVEVLDMINEDGHLCYVCRTSDDTEEVFDRSDLMDDGRIQRIVCAYERRYPPPWDAVCTWCDGEGCGECICDECERPCRHINGINYGCVLHPVV